MFGHGLRRKSCWQFYWPGSLEKERCQQINLADTHKTCQALQVRSTHKCKVANGSAKGPATNSRRLPKQKQYKELETKVKSLMGPKTNKFGWSQRVKKPGYTLFWPVSTSRIGASSERDLPMRVLCKMVQKCAKPEFTERIELQCLRLKGIATRKDLLRSAQGASKSLAIGRDFPTASISSP